MGPSVPGHGQGRATERLRPQVACAQVRMPSGPVPGVELGGRDLSLVESRGMWAMQRCSLVRTKAGTLGAAIGGGSQW